MEGKVKVTLLALLAALGVAAGTSVRCSTECSVASAKFSYVFNKTYTYAYTGGSQVLLKDVEDGVVEGRWATQVHLTWLTPCDVAMSFSNTLLDDERRTNDISLLERYPLVVTMMDGHVQGVCSHPDDDTWSINLKKGVASILQNSLPSLSVVNSGLNITETDVVGVCPTEYEIWGGGDEIMATKKKNHRLCDKRFATPDEVHLPWLKGPLPIQESQSKCTQNIVNGIITWVGCEDKSVVRPSYGAYKFVEAKQESELLLVTDSAPLPASLSRLSQVQLVTRSLIYDYETPKKKPSLVPELEQTFRHICQLTKQKVDPDTAKRVDKAVNLMRRVPEHALSQVYTKILSGQLCADHGKLKGLFLDAIAYVRESGAVPIMVRELTDGRASEERVALYSASLYLTPRPTAGSIEALRPLFELPSLLPSVTLSAASMINAFCRQNQCDEVLIVRVIAEALNTKLLTQCSPFSDEETQYAALLTLKALGNAGFVNQDISTSLLRCMRTPGVPTQVKVAAAHTYRLMACQKRVTEDVIDFALDPEMDTETRLAAYSTIVHCANATHLEKILNVMTTDENTQVRGFILSHLLNIQKTNSPHKKRLRRLLTNAGVPQDFKVDLMRYSRSFDLSFYDPSPGLSGELESSLIYAPGSFVPRSLALNLTAAFQEISMSVAELGVRVEGLEAILARLFGPDGYFKTSSFEKISDDFVKLLRKHGNITTPKDKAGGRPRRSTEASILANILNEIYHNNLFNIKGDSFLRILGQDIFFSSVSVDFSNIHLGEMKTEIISIFFNVLEAIKTLRIDSARVLRPELDYSFPTIHGEALKVSFQATVVPGLNVENTLNRLSTGSGLKVMPSLSAYSSGFVGYDAHFQKMGLKMESYASSSNGVTAKIRGQRGKSIQLQLDLPDDMNIVNTQVETFFMRKKRDQPATKIFPPFMRDVRVRHKSCATDLESIIGLKLCYEVDVPDVSHCDSLPLGAPSFARLSLNRTEASMKGFVINATLEKHFNSEVLTLDCQSYGSHTRRDFITRTTVLREQARCSVFTTMTTTGVNATAALIVTDTEREKSIELIGQLHYGIMVFQKIIKATRKITKTSLSQEDSFEFSYGNNLPPHRSDQILQLGVIRRSNGSRMNMDVQAATQHALSHYIDLGAEISVDVDQRQYFSVIPSVQLRKFELECNVGAWNVTSFIRKLNLSGLETKYASTFSVTRSKRQLAFLQTDLLLQGTPAVDYVAQLVIRAGLERVQYKGLVSVYLQVEQTGASLHFLRVVPSTETLLLLELMQTSTDTPSYSVKAKVEAPRLISPASLVMGLHLDSTYAQVAQTSVVVKYGTSILLHVDGPLSITAEESVIKIHTQWAIFLLGRFYKFESLGAFGEDLLIIRLKLQTPQGQPLFHLDLSSLERGLDETNFQAMFLLVHYVDVKSNLLFDGRQVHGKISCLTFPGEQDARRVTVSGDLDLTTSKLGATLWWDADRDLSKHFSTEMTVTKMPHLADFSSVQGVVKYQNRTCLFLAVREYVHLRHSLIMKTSAGFEIHTGSRRDMVLEFENSFEARNSSANIETFVSYNGPEGRSYKFRSSLDMEESEGSHNSTVESQITYSSATGNDVLLTMEMTHTTTATTRLTRLKGGARLFPIKRPLGTDLTWTRRGNMRSLVWSANDTTLRTLMGWELDETTAGTVEGCGFFLNLRGIQTFMRDIVNLVTLYKTCLEAECPEDTHTGFLNTPNIRHHDTNHSATMLATGVHRVGNEPPFGSSEGDAGMCTVTARYFHDERTGKSSYEGKLSHPTLASGVTAVLEYRGIDSGDVRGTFELNIFPDVADRITGNLASVLLANNTVRVDANLTTRLLSYHPRVTLNMAASPHALELDLKFHKNSSQKEVNFSTRARLNRITEYDLTLALAVAAGGSVPLDVTGVVVPRWDPECLGLQMTVASTLALLGSHNSTLSVCGPAFLELTTARRDGRGKAYNARFGVRNPLGLEGKLAVRDQETQTTLEVLKSQFTVYPHIDAEFSCMKEELEIFKAEVGAAMQESLGGVAEWSRLVYQAVVEEARRQHLVFPPPQITALTQQIQTSVEGLFAYVVQQKLRPTYELLKRLVDSPAVSYVRKIGVTTWLQLQRARSQLPRALYHPYQEHIIWEEESKTYNYIVKEVGNQVIETIESGGQNLLPSLQYLWQELEETELFMALMEDLRAFVIAHTDPEKLNVLVKVLGKVLSTLRGDLAYLRNNSALLRTAMLSLRAINSAMQKVTLTPLTELRDMLWAYDSHANIPTNKLLGLYYFLSEPPLWRDMLPPWNRTAMVVGGTEILTFDGAKLRMPLSPCEVILATFAGNKITMSHPVPDARPQVTVATPGYVIVVKPDFHVLLNGQDIGDRELQVGEITIMVAHAFTTIELPLVKVRIFGNQKVVSIEAQGWTYGHLAGMLGTYDGEAGNDNLLSTGIKAPDLWHLVKSWQEDQHCHTPRVAPVDGLSIQDAERVVHCYPLLGVWGRCNAVLRPDPFIDMCHHSRNPCDAAQAYRALCGTMGVDPLFPRGC